MLADRIEAVDTLTETILEYVRDGRATAHLIVDDLSAVDFDEAPGFLTGPRAKVERIGPHAIEYRKGDDQP